MRKHGKLLKSQATFTREELAELLEGLAARVREGTLTLGENSGKVEMDLPQTFTVEMEVQNTGKRVLKRELEMEIVWPIEPDGTPLPGRDPRSGFVVT
ncbi:amphi-Trp domain-containing protein [Corynebacterium nasicanis]|uniref:Amphi-Trp domain-containing protein n=1 Tax=Corynebacterium nasicanis TaxID=1448267 RepID=A0ABW1QBI4_9CORY